MNSIKPAYFIVGIPILIWIASYLYLALHYKRWNIFQLKVHESGRYTLVGTIFYFNHFLRELLPDTFFALCIYWTYKVAHRNITGGEADGNFTLILIALILYLSVVFLGSVRSVGLRNTILDLFQYRELDTVVEFGSHWQMHFLSSLTIMLLCILPAAFSKVEDHSQAVIIFLAYFTVSVLFKTGKKAIRDKRWIMHGGREVLTFFPLVVLPSYALNLRLESLNISPWSIAVISLVCAQFLYYLIVYKRTDVRGMAQGDFGIPYLIASHFFEHILDCVYIFLFVALLINE